MQSVGGSREARGERREEFDVVVFVCSGGLAAFAVDGAEVGGNSVQRSPLIG